MQVSHPHPQSFHTFSAALTSRLDVHDPLAQYVVSPSPTLLARPPSAYRSFFLLITGPRVKATRVELSSRQLWRHGGRVGQEQGHTWHW